MTIALAHESNYPHESPALSSPQQARKALRVLRQEANKVGHADVNAYVAELRKTGKLSPRAAAALMKLSAANDDTIVANAQREEATEKLVSEQKGILEKVRTFLGNAPKKIGEALWAIPGNILHVLRAIPAPLLVPLLLFIAIVGVVALPTYLAMTAESISASAAFKAVESMTGAVIPLETFSRALTLLKPLSAALPGLPSP